MFLYQWNIIGVCLITLRMGSLKGSIYSFQHVIKYIQSEFGHGLLLQVVIYIYIYIWVILRKRAIFHFQCLIFKIPF